MEDDDEENIYCVIDINLRIVIPWQPMTSEEMTAKPKGEKCGIAMMSRSKNQQSATISSSASSSTSLVKQLFIKILPENL